MSHSAEELAAAVEEAARHQPIQLPLEWFFPTSLRAASPRDGHLTPPEPLEPPTAEIVHAEPYEAPAAVTAHPEANLVPVWLLHADISVWRTRWFWRLVASMIVRRLGRGHTGIERSPGASE